MPAAILGVKMAVDILRVRMALLKMEFMATKLGGWLTAVTTALKVQIPQLLAWNAAWLANPITWIVLGIVALIGVVILLWKNWDKVSAAVLAFWDKTKEVIANLWDKVKSVFSAIGQFIKEHFVDFLLMALGPIGQIVLAITKISSGIKSMITGNKSIKIETVSGDTPQEKPKVKNNPNKGTIGVDVNLTNKTDKKATVTTRVEGSNDLNLKPAA